MHSHSASERSIGYIFLIRARVANHYPTHPFRTVSERLSEKGTSNSPSEDLAAIRSAKWTEKPLLGDPLGSAGSVSETFRTVSLGDSVNNGRWLSGVVAQPVYSCIRPSQHGGGPNAKRS